MEEKGMSENKGGSSGDQGNYAETDG